MKKARLEYHSRKITPRTHHVPAAAKTFTWAFNGDALTMDPHASNNTFTNAFVNYIYEGLTRHNYEIKIEPALATSWRTVSPTVWRFALRKGVKFHNGADFDADDVVATWQRMNTPGALVMTVVNPIKDVRKVDSHTVDIETKQPFPILLSILTHFFVMDKDWMEKNDAKSSTDLQQKKENYANRNANGTGPFKLKSREVDVKTVLEVNPNWWDKPQHNLTEVVFTPIKSDATRTSSLLSGAIDGTISIPLQDIQRVSADPKLQVIQGPALRTIFPPCPGCISMLCTSNPEGILPNGRQLPRRGSALWPEYIFCPIFRPKGARIYVFCPSSYCTSAILQLRLGSYSMAATLPGTPNLSRLKSMRRSIRLAPPPRWRTVTRP